MFAFQTDKWANLLQMKGLCRTGASDYDSNCYQLTLDISGGNRGTEEEAHNVQDRGIRPFIEIYLWEPICPRILNNNDMCLAVLVYAADYWIQVLTEEMCPAATWNSHSAISNFHSLIARQTSLLACVRPYRLRYNTTVSISNKYFFEA